MFPLTAPLPAATLVTECGQQLKQHAHQSAISRSAHSQATSEMISVCQRIAIGSRTAQLTDCVAAVSGSEQVVGNVARARPDLPYRGCLLCHFSVDCLALGT
jgi:hypothetical protein